MVNNTVKDGLLVYFMFLLIGLFSARIFNYSMELIWIIALVPTLAWYIFHSEYENIKYSYQIRLGVNGAILLLLLYVTLISVNTMLPAIFPGALAVIEAKYIMSIIDEER